MDILKRPTIEYDKKEGRPNIPLPRPLKDPDYTLTKERVLELLDILDQDISEVSDLLDEELKVVGVKAPAGPVLDALRKLAKNEEANVLSYTAYVAGLNSNSSEGETVARAYRDFHTSVWGNASILYGDLLRMISTEASTMKSHLVSADEDEETLMELAQWIGDSRIASKSILEVVPVTEVDESILTEMDHYEVGELKGTQAYMSRHVALQVETAEKRLSSLRMIFSPDATDRFYRSMADTKAVVVVRKTDGIIGRLISGISTIEDREATGAILDLEQRSQMFAEALPDIVNSIAAAKLAQNINKQISHSGGITVGEALSLEVSTPETHTDEAIKAEYLDGVDASMKVTYSIEDPLLLAEDMFPAIDDFTVVQEKVVEISSSLATTKDDLLAHLHDDRYVLSTDHTKAAHDALSINADTVDSKHATDFILKPVEIIAPIVDLNVVTTAGMYFCPYSATAAALANCPTTYAFSMLVEKHAGVKQTLTVFTTTSSDTWTRNEYMGTWGAWCKVVMYGDYYKLLAMHADYMSADYDGGAASGWRLQNPAWAKAGQGVYHSFANCATGDIIDVQSMFYITGAVNTTDVHVAIGFYNGSTELAKFSTVNIPPSSIDTYRNANVSCAFTVPAGVTTVTIRLLVYTNISDGVIFKSIYGSTEIYSTLLAKHYRL